MLTLGCQSDGSGQGEATDGTSNGTSTVGTVSAGCPIGSQGCPCTQGGTCDPELECIDGYCVDPDCAIGSKGCPCTDGGACDAGLECNAGYCVDAGSGTTTTPTTDASTTADPSNTGVDSTGADTGDTGQTSNTTTMSTTDTTDTGQGGQVVFSAAFLHNVPADQQCTDWNTFRGELAGHTYHTVTVRGSEDPVGKTCSAAADDICQNIFTGAPASIGCNGAVWSTGDCMGGMELDVSGFICGCGIQYTVRPCAPLNQWGGLDTNSCDTPSQTVEVICEY